MTTNTSDKRRKRNSYKRENIDNTYSREIPHQIILALHTKNRNKRNKSNVGSEARPEITNEEVINLLK